MSNCLRNYFELQITEAFSAIWKHLFIILYSEYCSSKVLHSLQVLACIGHDAVVETIVTSTRNSANDLKRAIYLQSPYYADGMKIEQMVLEEIESSASSGIKNDFFSKDTGHFLLNELIPYASLWGSFFTKSSNSNANAECFFRIVKKDILSYKLYQKPGRFICKINEYASAKFTEIFLEIPEKPLSKTEQSLINADLKNQEDNWSKKKKFPKNYFVDDLKSKYSSLF